MARKIWRRLTKVIKGTERLLCMEKTGREDTSAQKTQTGGYVRRL